MTGNDKARVPSVVGNRDTGRAGERGPGYRAGPGCGAGIGTRVTTLGERLTEVAFGPAVPIPLEDL